MPMPSSCRSSAVYPTAVVKPTQRSNRSSLTASSSSAGAGAGAGASAGVRSTVGRSEERFRRDEVTITREPITETVVEDDRVIIGRRVFWFPDSWSLSDEERELKALSRSRSRPVRMIADRRERARAAVSASLPQGCGAGPAAKYSRVSEDPKTAALRARGQARRAGASQTTARSSSTSAAREKPAPSLASLRWRARGGWPAVDGSETGTREAEWSDTASFGPLSARM
eukprot:NODE_3865_length_903_cov_21.704918_g3559_i0.p1 GENE.NODE_3865_length_903_cov_21.704918_g3559_i0~~NODE_3865_length_903_cov_21.704918_g3559_i0.p1  ORF type:complete len:228 (+),score=24.09 NODE_3865_length_903_cov_21.704918_g3559_i0:82-765(+)